MIRMSGVSFAYGDKPPLFKELNIALEPGNIYGLLGKKRRGQNDAVENHRRGPPRGRRRVPRLRREAGDRPPTLLRELFFIPEDFSVPAMRLDVFVSLYSPFYPRFDRRLSTPAPANSGSGSTSGSPHSLSARRRSSSSPSAWRPTAGSSSSTSRPTASTSRPSGSSASSSPARSPKTRVSSSPPIRSATSRPSSTRSSSSTRDGSSSTTPSSTCRGASPCRSSGRNPTGVGGVRREGARRLLGAGGEPRRAGDEHRPRASLQCRHL